jgi:hypothetical protein
MVFSPSIHPRIAFYPKMHYDMEMEGEEETFVLVGV